MKVLLQIIALRLDEIVFRHRRNFVLSLIKHHTAQLTTVSKKPIATANIFS